MSEFRYHGNIDSLGRALEAMKRGTRVKRSTDGVGWIVCPAGETGSGWSYADVLAIGSRYNKNIFASSYDEGTPGAFDGRRNFNKAYSQVVGDPVGVAYGPDVVIDMYTMYLGVPVAGNYLVMGASGMLAVGGDASTAIAEVQVGAVTNGDPIKIKALR